MNIDPATQFFQIIEGDRLQISSKEGKHLATVPLKAAFIQAKIPGAIIRPDSDLAQAGWSVVDVGSSTVSKTYLISKTHLQQAVDEAQKIRSSAVLKAAERGDLTQLRLLLDEGAILDSYRGAALQHAARGSIEMVKEILKDGNIPAIDRGKAVIHAADRGCGDIVAELLKGPVSLKERGDALIRAADYGHGEVVRLLYDPLIFSWQLGVAAGYAAENGHLAIVEFLNPLILDEYRGQSLINAANNGHSEIVRVLIESGLTLLSEPQGEALKTAVSNGDLEVVGLLLEEGGSISDNDLIEAFNDAQDTIKDLLAAYMTSRGLEWTQDVEQQPVVEWTFDQTMTAWLGAFQEAFPGESSVLDYQVLLDHEKKDQLNKFLLKLTQTEDFKNAGSQDNVIFKVHRFLTGAVQNETFREHMLTLIDEALSSCGDRVALYLAQIEIQWKLDCEGAGLDPVGLAKLLIGVKRVELLDKHATQVVQEHGLGDAIETFLYYQVKLKEALNLPLSTEGMLYPAMSGVSEQMLTLAKEAILAQTTSQEAVLALLVESSYWSQKLRQDHEVDFEPIHEALSDVALDSSLSDTGRIDAMAAINQTMRELEQRLTQTWLDEHYAELL